MLWLTPIPIAMGDVIFFNLFTGFLSQLVPSYQRDKTMGLTRAIATLVWSFTAMLGGCLLAWHPNGALFYLATIGLGSKNASMRVIKSSLKDINTAVRKIPIGAGQSKSKTNIA